MFREKRGPWFHLLLLDVTASNLYASSPLCPSAIGLLTAGYMTTWGDTCPNVMWRDLQRSIPISHQDRMKQGFVRLES